MEEEEGVGELPARRAMTELRMMGDWSTAVQLSVRRERRGRRDGLASLGDSISKPGSSASWEGREKGGVRE